MPEQPVPMPEQPGPMPEQPAPVPEQPAVVARDLTLVRGTHTALQDATCHVPAGKVTAIIGPNGSGKSSLLHAINGLVEPAGGELTVLGGSPQRAHRRVSYVLQTVEAPADLPLTVRQCVAMGRYASLGWFGRARRADREAVDAAMERLHLTDLADRHLHALSGGQQHRVLVAQGLAQDHDILVLDEPLAGLDVVSAEVIDGILHDTGAARTRTIVHTTHDLSEAAAADHVVLLAGTVVAEGAPDSVLTDDFLVDAFGTRGLHPPRA